MLSWFVEEVFAKTTGNYLTIKILFGCIGAVPFFTFYQYSGKLLKLQPVNITRHKRRIKVYGNCREKNHP
jgi:hypothetical protein